MNLTTITTEKTSTTGKQEEQIGYGPSSGLYFLKADLYSGFWTHGLLAQVFPAISRRLIMLTPQRPRSRALSRETRLYWVVTMESKRCSMIRGQDLFQWLQDSHFYNNHLVVIKRQSLLNMFHIILPVEIENSTKITHQMMKEGV